MENYYSTPYVDFSTARPVTSIPTTSIPTTSIPTTSIPTTSISYECGPCIKNDNNPPWPVIIMAIVGFVLAVYTAIGFNVNQNLIVFGAIFIFLWTVMWCLILWVLWNSGQYTEAWGLLILPLVLVFLFFMIVIVVW
jgi:hypothetical protein